MDKIVYKELSSLSYDLGISKNALYTASNHISSHYNRVTIPKNNGEMRTLYVPDEFLKSIQRKILQKILIRDGLSPFATAYRFRGSAKKNAQPHLNSKMILKLDIKNFFDSIFYPLIKEKVFHPLRYSEQNRVLLALLCTYNEVLPQGAPTSPAISNIIMRDFDNTIGFWCKDRNIVYTRYCDDMTFSGDFVPKEIISLVKKELLKMGFYLNNKKTVVAKKGQKQIVTGIIVNEKLNVSDSYRKKIRQEIYYCMKFGVDEHLKYIKSQTSKETYLNQLLGRVNYVLSINIRHPEFHKYKSWLINQIKKEV